MELTPILTVSIPIKYLFLVLVHKRPKIETNYKNKYYNDLLSEKNYPQKLSLSLLVNCREYLKMITLITSYELQARLLSIKR